MRVLTLKRAQRWLPFMNGGERYGEEVLGITCKCCQKTKRWYEDVPFCFTCSFWLEKVDWRLNGYPHNGVALVIGHNHYVVYFREHRVGNGACGGQFRLFPGHTFKYASGEILVVPAIKAIVESNNTWHQGEIPEMFRDILTPNAETLPRASRVFPR